MKLELALKRCLRMVVDKAKHKHYDWVVKLRNDLYLPLSTGKNAGHLIKRFNRRENEEEHKQRTDLTVLITGSIANTLMAPVRKIGKVRPVVDKATFKTTDTKSNDKLKAAVAKFYAGKSVDHFFESVLMDQGAIDPNAFCLTLFDKFDERYEEPRPYPSIITCVDAWNYEFANGELQWLLVHRDIDYVVNPTPKELRDFQRGKGKKGALEPVPQKLKGHAFWMYTDMNHIHLTQVDPRTISSQVEGVLIDARGNGVDSPALETDYYFRVTKEELYVVRFYEHLAGQVQGFRLGFIPDQCTMGETMVNLWHAAVPFMLKGVKAGSELDLSAALHAFLQKLQYTNRCPGFRDPKGTQFECNDGYIPGGNEKCKQCGGEGWVVHRSGQDHITFAMPRSKDDFLELENMVRYVQLPVEVLEWQDKYVDKLEIACHRAVYNSDRFQSDQNRLGADTATNGIINLDNIYDTIRPATMWWSQSRVTQYRLIASFVVGSKSMKDFTCEHEFPRNLRFETIGERVALLKALREANATVSAIAQVNDAVLEDVFGDDPDGLMKARTMAYFDPFAGKTEGAIITMISQDNTIKKLKLFWVNSSWIYAVAELDHSTGEASFWAMERKKQRVILDKILDDLMKTSEEEADAAIERAQLGMETGDPNNPDPDAPTPDDEKETVPAKDNGRGLPASPGTKITE